MEKIKVLFVSAANSIHTVKWVNALSKKFEIHLVYCKNHKPTVDTIDSDVILHELKFNSPAGYYLNAIQLHNIYIKIKPNIVNVHYASGYGTLARMSKIKPVLLSVWGSDVYDFPNESKAKKNILFKNVMYADYIASTSNAMAKELKRQIPQLQKDIFITPFGVDTEKFNKIEVKKEIEYFNVGIIKALKPKYGIEYAVLAIKKLKDKLKAENKGEISDLIKLYIYGDGEEKEKIKNLIQAEELTDSVFLMGKIPNDEVPNALNTFDVFCATSILNSESFGVAVVEAMACEIPVVATKTDGFCEVMKDGETGFLVEKKNIEEIVNALERILNDKKKAIQMGINGRERVLKNYDWKNNVNYMSEIYVKLSKDVLVDWKN